MNGCVEITREKKRDEDGEKFEYLKYDERGQGILKKGMSEGDLSKIFFLPQRWQNHHPRSSR